MHVKQLILNPIAGSRRKSKLMDPRGEIEENTNKEEVLNAAAGVPELDIGVKQKQSVAAGR